MPIRLDLQEEQYPPTGGIGGEGQRKVLGRPQMEVLTLLAREALQNSWDARVSRQGPITFMVDAWSLTNAELRTLRNQVFAELPEGLPLKRVLSESTVNVLCISDRGTCGLVGPTRANELDLDNPQRNFVAFVRDVGRAASTQVDGGTYGYGKASFYMASRASTICMHTGIRDSRGRFEHRFIAAGVGDQHNAIIGGRTVRRTGRCWWGQQGRDAVVDPLTGSDARDIAAALGMPAFHDDHTGTSILLVAPDLNVESDGETKERTLEQAVTRLVSDLVWCAWPRMISGRSGTPAINFQARVRREGRYQEIPFPDPARFPPVSCFVQAFHAAMRSLQTGRTEEGCTPIKRYSDILGWLALKNFGVLPRKRLDTGDRDGPEWVGQPSHHVALMRGPRLIVKYLEGPILPTDALEYAGVFINKDHVEEAFALAEPPTHDDWRPETLTADLLQKSQVRVALQKIREETIRFVGRLASATLGAGELQPLGAFAEQLGNLLTQVEGLGRPEVPLGGGGGGGGGGGPRRLRAKVRQLEDVEYAMVEDRKVAVIPFQVFPLPGTHGTQVRAVTSVSVADGDQTERDPPEGAVVPEVVAWLTPGGNCLAEGTDLVSIPAYEVGIWKVQVRVPEDARISVELRTE
jgi:hypothetical protein